MRRKVGSRILSVKGAIMFAFLKSLSIFLAMPAFLANLLPSGSDSHRMNPKKVSDSGVCVNGSFEAGCAAYGFTYSSDWSPLKTQGFLCDSFSQTDTNGLQYQTDIQDVLLRNRNAWNVYCYAYRVVQTAYQPGRYNGFLGIGSYGDKWYARGMHVVADLSEEYNYALTDWSPKNAPKDGTYQIGISYGSSGFQVSMPININFNELSISSSTKLPTRHFEVNYEVKGYSAYSANSLCLYGMFVFATPTTPYREPYISVKFQSRYFGKEYHGMAYQDFTRAL